jgi:hypothetical protein
MTKKGVIQWENGLGGSGGFKRIFFEPKCLNFKQKIKKNPFGSARSVPSVLPSYHKTIVREVYVSYVPMCLQNSLKK